MIKARPISHRMGMNGTEAAYADYLDILKAGTQIKRWRFEAYRLRLGDGWMTTYTPDFAVTMMDDTLEFHEVKGFWREDARVKIKNAVHLYPEHKFIAVQKKSKKDGGGWKVEEF